MSYPVFEQEVLKLTQSIDPKVKDLQQSTKLGEILDSLACVEIIQCAQEELGIELTFEEVRGAKTYGDLCDLLEEKGCSGK